MQNLLFIAFVVLLVLKLATVVVFSWWWVFSPLIAIVVLNVGFWLLFASGAFFIGGAGRRRK